MTVLREVVAGYQAAKQVLTDPVVHVEPAGTRADVAALTGVTYRDPRSYLVGAVAYPDGVALQWFDAYGDSKGRGFVAYPTSIDAPDFVERLAVVLLSAATDFKTQAEAARAYAYNPTGAK